MCSQAPPAAEEDPLAAADAEFAARLQAKLDAEDMQRGAGGAGARGAGGRGGRQAAPYIRISEQEIADDYPMPKQYNKGEQHTPGLPHRLSPCTSGGTSLSVRVHAARRGA